MSVYEFGPFQLDVEQLLLTRRGDAIALGPKVVATLLALVEHPGDVLAKGALLDRIWPEGFVDEANLAQNVHVLRKTFRRYGMADPIETIPRRGYRFTAPVRRLAAAPVQAPARAPEHAPRRRVAAVLAGVGFVAASLLLVASNGVGHRGPAPAVRADDRAQLYQIGRYYWNLRTRDGVRKSLGYFEQVVDAAPRDARGYAALADANVAMGDYCYGTHQPAVYFARARAYANTALALDPNSAEAHATLGFLALDRNDANVAQAEL
ncbi:MAG TPA: transcriptional regulator, partial [Xanthomonadales bacterium]|nr:transcriptional regulator [Xanthomonadales bacterium]